MPRTTSLLRVCALLLALSPFFVASARGLASPERVGKDAKLDSQIALLAAAATPIDGFGPPVMPAGLVAMRDAGLMRFDAVGRLVATVAAAGELKDAEAAIRRHGGVVERSYPDDGSLRASVPVAALSEVAHDRTVRYLGLPRYPVLNAGGHTTEGDAILNVDDLRSAYGVDGEGVKIGVISDGLDEFEKSQNSGDLPPSINYTTCNVVSEWDPTGPIAGGEGTAILEIVHDLAPGAELWFGSFGMNSPTAGAEEDFIAAVNCLAQHVDVVVDDISWFNTGPYDGTSAVSLNTSAALNNPANPIRLYATSVGNWAQRHYGDPYEPCGGTLQTFQASANTIDRQATGPLCANPFKVTPGGSIAVFLQWDDGFGASCNDYDLQLRERNSSVVLAASLNPQTCSQDPVEALAWRNLAPADVIVDLVVENVGGQAEPRNLDLFLAGASDVSYYTPAGSVPNQGDAAGGVISVGAIGAGEPGHDAIQAYSSNGPTDGGDMKPDITAIDCVNVTGNGLNQGSFCGTSAAAPHIAGIAALLLECNPSLLAADPGGGSAAGDRASLLTSLRLTALERGVPGPDNVYGAGLVDPMAAAEDLCVGTTGILGDVDCDETVDAVDALFILREVAEIPPEQPCIELGDVDCDLALDAVDGLGVLRYVAGIPLPTPPGCRAIGTIAP